jgi:Family of unknown function (DUF6516)
VNPFRSLREYEEFVYRLQQRFPSIVMSTLVVSPRAARQAKVAGEIGFSNGYKLVIRERLTSETGALLIERYSYEAWHNIALLYWCDSQAHPNNPDLASTHPHHKHVPPDIKHNRIPAPGLSFTQPNLPLLIAEIEQLIA